MGAGGVEGKAAALLSGIWLPRGRSGKESTCQAGDADLIPRFRRPPGGGNGNPLQYSGLKIPWTEEPSGLKSMGHKRVGHH